MHGDRLLLAAIAGSVSLGILASACSRADVRTSPTVPISTTTPTRAIESTTPTPAPTQAAPKKIPRTFDEKNFGDSVTDVNGWMPLAPGLQSVSKGFVNVGDRHLPHIRVTTITDVTKVIDGVLAVLVLDQDYDGGQLSEQSIDYLAEDEGGNVWYVGSYTEVYEGGQFLNAEDAWLAGVNEAVPGMYLPGDPKVGGPSFYQTNVPGDEQSTAQVVRISPKTCVPFRCFSDVLVIQEQGSENKYWAPGVGAILTEPLAGEAQETEELVNLKQLSRDALGEFSTEALRLDHSAAAHVPTVFGGSKAAKRNP